MGSPPGLWHIVDAARVASDTTHCGLTIAFTSRRDPLPVMSEVPRVSLTDGKCPYCFTTAILQMIPGYVVGTLGGVVASL